MEGCGCQIHMTSKCGEVCYTGKIDFCSDCEKKNIFIAGYSEALNDLGIEVFRIIDWGECHGNGQLISRQQVKNIIGSLNTKNPSIKADFNKGYGKDLRINNQQKKDDEAIPVSHLETRSSTEEDKTWDCKTQDVDNHADTDDLTNPELDSVTRLDGRRKGNW